LSSGTCISPSADQRHRGAFVDRDVLASCDLKDLERVRRRSLDVFVAGDGSDPQNLKFRAVEGEDQSHRVILGNEDKISVKDDFLSRRTGQGCGAKESKHCNACNSSFHIRSPIGFGIVHPSSGSEGVVL
jgi:hypothetical protein